MKTFKTITTLLLLALIFSCKNDDDITVLSDEKEIVSFTFLASDNTALSMDIQATINETTQTITAILPEDTPLDDLTPTLVVSQEATYTPIGSQDFTDTVIYTVTAEDETTVDYDVLITRELSERDVLQLILDLNPNNTLTWDLENTGDIGDFDEVTLNQDGNIIELLLVNFNLPQLPVEITRLTSLENLFWRDNNVSVIPAEVGSLTNLKVLALDTNQISTLPEEMGMLSNLEYLYLLNNPLSSMPQEICDLQIANGGILTIFADNGEGCM